MTNVDDDLLYSNFSMLGDKHAFNLLYTHLWALLIVCKCEESYYRTSWFLVPMNCGSLYKYVYAFLSNDAERCNFSTSASVRNIN